MKNNIELISNKNTWIEWYKNNLLCETSCPLSIPIEKLIEFISNNELDSALKIIATYNPFPSLTGRLCKYPCEEACNRKKTDGSVKIQNIEKYIGDYAINTNYIPEHTKSNGKKVLIIGAGLTGLSSAYFLKKEGFDVEIFEKEDNPWGKMKLIPNFELEKEILDKEIKKIYEMDIKISFSKKILKSDLNFLSKKYDAMLIATGKSITNVKYQNSTNMIDAIDFLTKFSEKNNDLSKIGKDVAVIGINEIGLLAGRLAIRMGAKKVDMYYKNSKGSILTADNYLRKARQEGIRMNYYCDIKNIITNKDGSIGKIEFIKTKSDVRTSEISIIPNTEFIVEADSIIYADYEEEDADDSISEKLHRGDSDLSYFSSGNVFNYNDVPVHSFNLIDIIENSKNVSDRICEYLFNKHSELVNLTKNNEAYFSRIDKEMPVNYDLVEKPPVKCEELSLANRIISFEPVSKTYTKEEAKSECDRCFKCSHIIEIDNLDLCTHCGICVDICPTEFFSQEKRIHPFIENVKDSYGGFLLKLIGLSEKNIEKYSCDFTPQVISSSLCLRCFQCVNECPTKIIHIKRVTLRSFT